MSATSSPHARPVNTEGQRDESDRHPSSVHTSNSNSNGFSQPKLIQRSFSQSGPLSPVSEDGGPPSSFQELASDEAQQYQRQNQHSHHRDRSDSQASGSSSALSSSGYDSRTTDQAGSSATFSRTTATEGDAAAAALRALQHQQQQSLIASLNQPSRYTPLSHLVYPSQERQLTALSRGVQQHQYPQEQGRSVASPRRHASVNVMSNSSPFSSISGQRHSSLGGASFQMHGGNRMMSPSEAAHAGSPSPYFQSGSPHQSHAGSGSAMSFAAAGMQFHHPSMGMMATPFQPDNNARMSYVDESGLSPDEFAFYLPALLRLKESPSGVDGLYDEQDALRYLREECGIELRDEAMIMALFERTPLGIKPGHFFAWLRLASWAQQGQMPTKTLLFTQTQPVHTASMRKLSGRQTARPMTMNTTHAPSISISNSLGDIRREAGSADFHHHISPRQAPIAAFNQSIVTASPPPPPAPHAKTISRQGQHSRMGSMGGASMAAAMTISPSLAGSNKPVPMLPGSELNKSANPFRDTQTPGLQATTQHPPYTLPTSQTIVYKHAAPALPTPAPPRDPSPGKLPIDALLGFDPSPNPFKQNKPRIVRPTPVVATASAPVPNPFRTPAPQTTRERGDSTSSRSIISIDRDRARDGLSTYGGSHGASLRKDSGDRLPPPLPPRAGISPLIQAGLNAASSVQKAKQALPPKTYMTIQRSGTTVPVKAKRPEPRLLTGEPAPPEVVAPLAQRAAERDAELSGARKRASISAASGTHRRSVSEAATMIRRASEEYDTSRQSEKRVTSVTELSRTSSPGAYSRSGGDPVTSKRLARLPDIDDADAEDERSPSRRSGAKSSVPGWLQEQDELHRTGQDASQRGQIPESVTMELDSPRDEISENAMSAASIERPGNPFSHREQDPPPPVMKDRPLGRSKTLSNKHAPPAPPRKRNESFPASLNADDQKAAFKKGVAQVQRSQSHTLTKPDEQKAGQQPSQLRVQRLSKSNAERPSPIEEDPLGEKAAKTPAVEAADPLAEAVTNGDDQADEHEDDKEARKSLVDHADAVDDEFHDADDTDDADAEVQSSQGKYGKYARLD